MNDFFTANLTEVDPIIAEAIDDEVRRQSNGLELIASENFRSVRSDLFGLIVG